MAEVVPIMNKTTGFPTVPEAPRQRLEQRESIVDRVMGRDPLMVAGQEFGVMSYVAPRRSKLSADRVHVKFHGAFATVAEAERHVKALHDLVPFLDIHIVKMGEWLQVPPPTDVLLAARVAHDDPQLRAIMSTVMERRQNEKVAFDKRVSAMKEAGAKTYEHNRAKAQSERLRDIFERRKATEKISGTSDKEEA